jgi:hypothetical protein
MGLLLLAVSTSPAADNGAGLQLISQAKMASGGSAWDRLEVMHDTGKIVLVSGQVAKYEHWSDLRSLSTRANSPEGFMIYNGQVAYQCQNAACNPPTQLDPLATKSAAYLNSFGYFFPDRFPATFQYKGGRVEGRDIYDIVEVSPTGLAAADIWINDRTHMVFRIISADGQIQVDLTDYKKVNGVMVPFTQIGEGVTVKSKKVKFERAGAVSFSLPAAHRH